MTDTNPLCDGIPYWVPKENNKEWCENDLCGSIVNHLRRDGSDHRVSGLTIESYSKNCTFRWRKSEREDYGCRKLITNAMNDITMPEQRLKLVSDENFSTSRNIRLCKFKMHLEGPGFGGKEG